MKPGDVVKISPYHWSELSCEYYGLITGVQIKEANQSYQYSIISSLGTRLHDAQEVSQVIYYGDEDENWRHNKE